MAVARYLSPGKKTPEYIAWFNMRARCGYAKHPNAKNYSERGIRVCAEWLASFEAFAEHVGPRPGPGHSVERRDNDGHYEPGNVCWATRKEQARNTRRNCLVTYNGRTATAAEWDETRGYPAGTVASRAAMWWDDERAVTTPHVPRAEASATAEDWLDRVAPRRSTTKAA